MDGKNYFLRYCPMCGRSWKGIADWDEGLTVSASARRHRCEYDDDWHLRWMESGLLYVDDFQEEEV